VGINTGPALVGNIGSAELRNFSALGDTTNTAARLQTYAPPGGVVIGERTFDLVRDVAKVRPPATPELKGKSVPTVVYELIGLDSEPGAGLPAHPAATAANSSSDRTGDARPRLEHVVVAERGSESE